MSAQDSGSLKIDAYCRCGATFHGSSIPPLMIQDIYAMWREMHGGEGHGAATREQAANARRRESRRLPA